MGRKKYKQRQEIIFGKNTKMHTFWDNQTKTKLCK